MSEEVKQEAPKTVEGATEAPTTAPVELTVQDLGVIRSIIDVATQRGAFKANELQAVGTTYNKLDSFLEQVKAADEAAKAANAPKEAESTEKK